MAGEGTFTASPAQDMWSLGVVAYEMLTGALLRCAAAAAAACCLGSLQLWVLLRGCLLRQQAEFHLRSRVASMAGADA